MARTDEPLGTPGRAGPSDYTAAHVERALSRERKRRAHRVVARNAARRAARALQERYGDEIAVFLYGSVLEPDRFRLDSDIDLAVRGLPPQRYYEAIGVAEAAVSSMHVDLIQLETAPGWLAAEVRDRGERLV